MSDRRTVRFERVKGTRFIRGPFCLLCGRLVSRDELDSCRWPMAPTPPMRESPRT